MMNEMNEERLLPRGFQAAGLHCGVKSNSTDPDLALFVSDRPASAAGVFTQNQVCGAPVKISRERLPSESLRAVVINSGNANACTAEQGLVDAQSMTRAVASAIGSGENDVAVCSTGVIGHFLPMKKILAGIPQVTAALSHEPAGFKNAAQAMMTTDTVIKQAVREVTVGGERIRVSGAAKGAAMIAPNMATMLAVVMTDAKLSKSEASQCLKTAVDQSFNCISVEGHTSTSDSVILMANGASGVACSEAERADLQQAMSGVCAELAQAIIRDAEGADHFVTIEAAGLAHEADARIIARTVADDALVKTAITGADPNWGRIVSACGRTGISLTESDITLRINGTLIFKSGKPIDYNEAALSRQMRDNRDVLLRLDFPFGDASARFWTSDLTQEYVRLNSEYTT